MFPDEFYLCRVGFSIMLHEWKFGRSFLNCFEPLRHYRMQFVAITLVSHFNWFWRRIQTNYSVESGQSIPSGLNMLRIWNVCWIPFISIQNESGLVICCQLGDLKWICSRWKRYINAAELNIFGLFNMKPLPLDRYYPDLMGFRFAKLRTQFISNPHENDNDPIVSVEFSFSLSLLIDSIWHGIIQWENISNRWLLESLT